MKTEEIEQKERLLKEARETLEIIEHQRRDVYQKIRDISVDIYCLQTGFSLNDDVFWSNGKRQLTGQITKFSYQHGEVRPVVTIYNKDGKLGKLTKYYWYSREILQKCTS